MGMRDGERKRSFAAGSGGWSTTRECLLSAQQRHRRYYSFTRRRSRVDASRRKKRSKPSRKYRSKATAEYQRSLEKTLFGTLGPASPVRKIDPATGKVLAIIKPHQKHTTHMSIKLIQRPTRWPCAGSRTSVTRRGRRHPPLGQRRSLLLVFYNLGDRAIALRALESAFIVSRLLIGIDACKPHRCTAVRAPWARTFQLGMNAVMQTHGQLPYTYRRERYRTLSHRRLGRAAMSMVLTRCSQ